MTLVLTQAKGLIFRITHRRNIPWILANGLHSSSSTIHDPEFVAIGNADLIGKRCTHAMPPPYGGFLSDYVPFYFTPFSPMMMNIVTGWGGVPKQERRDIVVLVSSIPKLIASGARFVFSDRHAYLRAARFSADPTDLDRVDWPLLQARSFKRDPDDPGKVERYQAEALVRDHLPVGCLIGAGCYDDVIPDETRAAVAATGAGMNVVTRTDWFF